MSTLECNLAYGHHNGRMVRVVVPVDALDDVKGFAGVLAVMCPTFRQVQERAWT